MGVHGTAESCIGTAPICEEKQWDCIDSLSKGMAKNRKDMRSFATAVRRLARNGFEQQTAKEKQCGEQQWNCLE